jgi:hypothetical protein
VRAVANSIPKSGTHLLDRLLGLLGLRQVDLGGFRPHFVEDGRFPFLRERVKPLLGLRKPEDVMPIGPHLVEGGRFPAARRLLRGRGENITVGVDAPQRIGRHWLVRRLSFVPEGCFVNAHCIYTPELAKLFREEGMKSVCLLRDPRDLAVSQMHYLKHNPPKNFFGHQAFMSLPSDHERLLVCIRGGALGGRDLQSLDQRYRQFLGWERDEGAVTVKFEDLVGPKGGGTREAQQRAVRRVAEHVGVSVSEQTMRRIEDTLFGGGRTFRRGQIGGWREEFSPEHVQASKDVMGPLLVELGYEAGPNW